MTSHFRRVDESSMLNEGKLDHVVGGSVECGRH